jgi:predicted O-methyltransferase YrrM
VTTTEHRPGPSAARIAAMLRAGKRPTEASFDRFLPERSRSPSVRHWTPLVAAMQCAEWLDELGAETIVDLGSGAGKFCVVAALAGHAPRITGIEQRGWLVSGARELARVFDVQDRVHFLHGALGAVTIAEADAYYLYNPFGENLFGPDDRVDDDVELSEARHDRDVAIVEDLLRRVRVGTLVVKYNGFGGQMPGGFEPVRVDWELPSVLRVWRKSR